MCFTLLKLLFSAFSTKQSERVIKQSNIIEKNPKVSTLQVSRNIPAQFERDDWYYQPQQYQYQQSQRRPLRQPLSPETGILNGFESFFSGMPPPI